MRSTTRQRRHRKATGIAIAIEHILKLAKQRVLVKTETTVALIQIETRFMAFCNVE